MLRIVRRLCVGMLLIPAIGAAERPANIVFILADDLGYGDLGCYGQRHFETPNLDRMAARGLRFTQHYAGSTVCAPSRACLLSGKHTGHVHQRVNGNGVQFPEDPEDVCVASYLRKAGYRTAIIGKSGPVVQQRRRRSAAAEGLRRVLRLHEPRAGSPLLPGWLWRNGVKEHYDGNKEKTGAHYSGDLFLAEALRFIEENADRPFFLHLALQQPHADLNAPDEWRDRFAGRYEEEPFAGGHYRAEPMPAATYAAMIAHLDDSVGRVLRRLEELGVERDKLVLFSSDNGPMSEGGWSRKIFDSNGPLRGGKRDLYEGGVRVPMIAWQPGVVAAGTETDHVSAFWDFLPTACEIAGAPVPDNIDGLSYLPTLTGRGEQPRHEYLYWEFYERGGARAVRSGDWKGVRKGRGAKRQPLELYDLSNDLGEERDLASDHPEIAHRLEAAMQDAHVPTEKLRFN